MRRLSKGRGEFGLALQRARLAKGLSQPQLAELVGVTRGAVSQWENAWCFPGNHLAAIETALGLPPAGLAALAQGPAAAW